MLRHTYIARIVIGHVCSLFVIIRTSNCRDFALRGSQK